MCNGNDERSKFGAGRASNGGRYSHHHEGNSAQVDLCAHGARCPFGRFCRVCRHYRRKLLFGGLHAFFIAALKWMFIAKDSVIGFSRIKSFSLLTSNRYAGKFESGQTFSRTGFYRNRGRQHPNQVLLRNQNQNPEGRTALHLTMGRHSPAIHHRMQTSRPGRPRMVSLRREHVQRNARDPQPS